MSAFAYISLLEVILKLSIVYILIIFNADKLILYAVLMFLVQMFIRLIYGFYCRLHFKECIFNYFYDKRLLNNIFTFSGWTILGHLSSVVSSQGLNILLNIFCGPVVNAARAITVQIQHAVQGFVLNFQTAINPQITKNYAKRNIEQMHSLIYASCRYSFFLLLFLSQPILLKCEYLLSLWLETVPNHTANFIRLTLLLTMLEAISNPLIIAAQATGNIKKYQIIIGSILLSIIPFSFILLEKGYMPVSVFILQNIITAIALFARLLLLRKMIFLSLRMFIRSVILKIIYVTCASMIVSIVLLFIIPQTTLWGLILVCILCMCSTLVLIYFLGLNKTERQFVVQKICKKNI
jgi:O-antigen/teichoic acid export membrane protein